MSEYKLKGYVARDKYENSIGEILYVGAQKPIYDEEMGMWDFYYDHAVNLPNDWFPELKWSDEPIEVELTIKKL